MTHLYFKLELYLVQCVKYPVELKWLLLTLVYYFCFGVKQIHPYGHAPARFAYALVSATGVFFLGCGATLYHGVGQLFLGTHDVDLSLLTVVVLAGSFVVESATLLYAVQVVRTLAKKERRGRGMGFMQYMREGSDTTAIAVVIEDAAAVSSLCVAMGSLYLTHVTGNCLWDTAGTLIVGTGMGFVAGFLIKRNLNMLTGRSVDRETLAGVTDVVFARPSVVAIHDLKAISYGPEDTRFKGELQFNGHQLAQQVLYGPPPPVTALVSTSQSQAQSQAAQSSQTDGSTRPNFPEGWRPNLPNSDGAIAGRRIIHLLQRGSLAEAQAKERARVERLTVAAQFLFAQEEAARLKAKQEKEEASQLESQRQPQPQSQSQSESGALSQETAADNITQSNTGASTSSGSANTFLSLQSQLPPAVAALLAPRPVTGLSRAAAEALLLQFGDAAVQEVGHEVDRIERGIRAQYPAFTHVDLEAHAPTSRRRRAAAAKAKAEAEAKAAEAAAAARAAAAVAMAAKERAEAEARGETVAETVTTHTTTSTTTSTPTATIVNTSANNVASHSMSITADTHIKSTSNAENDAGSVSASTTVSVRANVSANGTAVSYDAVAAKTETVSVNNYSSSAVTPPAAPPAAAAPNSAPEASKSNENTSAASMSAHSKSYAFVPGVLAVHPHTQPGIDTTDNNNGNNNKTTKRVPDTVLNVPNTTNAVSATAKSDAFASGSLSNTDIDAATIAVLAAAAAAAAVSDRSSSLSATIAATANDNGGAKNGSAIVRGADAKKSEQNDITVLAAMLSQVASGPLPNAAANSLGAIFGNASSNNTNNLSNNRKSECMLTTTGASAGVFAASNNNAVNTGTASGDIASSMDAVAADDDTSDDISSADDKDVLHSILTKRPPVDPYYNKVAEYFSTTPEGQAPIIDDGDAYNNSSISDRGDVSESPSVTSSSRVASTEVEFKGVPARTPLGQTLHSLANKKNNDKNDKLD